MRILSSVYSRSPWQGLGASCPLSRLTTLPRTIFVGLFIALGFFSSLIVYLQARQAKRSEAEMREQLHRLEGASAQVIALQQSNSALQERVLQLSEESTALAKKNLSTITGGDSFCYMAVNHQFGYPTPFFIHSGQCTLYDVGVRVVDLNRMRENQEPSTVLQLQLGEMQPGKASVNPQLRFLFFGETAQDFNIFFGARNGAWNQFLRLRKVDAEWERASQVWWFDPTKPADKPTFEDVSPDFPRNDKGEVDWGN